MRYILVRLSHLADLYHIMAAALNIPLLLERLAALERRVAEQDARIAELENSLAERDARIEELESQLTKNSSNSSKPPSSDPPNFERNQSRRKNSNRKPGGQSGHQGRTLKMVENPTTIIAHAPPSSCPDCGATTQEADFVIQSRHQVFDIPPPPPPIVIEHQVLACQCQGCGKVLSGNLPSDVAAAPTSYGKRIAGFVAYFSVRHYLPYKRLAELLRDVFGVEVSTGTIANMIDRTARHFAPTVAGIKAAIGTASVVGSDETFVREGGRRINIWVWCTRHLTYLARGPGRGFNVVEREWPHGLPNAIMVSDRLAAQLKINSARKQICQHHLLRECYGLAARKDATFWIEELIEVILRTIRAGAYGRRCYRRTAEFIEADLDDLLDTKYNGMISVKEADFLASLAKVRQYMTTCLHVRDVPPDNDECERDIRGGKVKSKVSGQWRSAKGTEDYCTIRSLIATAIKQGLRPIEVMLGTQRVALVAE